MTAAALVVLKRASLLCEPTPEFTGVHGGNISVVSVKYNKNVGCLPTAAAFKAPDQAAGSPHLIDTTASPRASHSRQRSRGCKSSTRIVGCRRSSCSRALAGISVSCLHPPHSTFTKLPGPRSSIRAALSEGRFSPILGRRGYLQVAGIPHRVPTAERGHAPASPSSPSAGNYRLVRGSARRGRVLTKPPSCRCTELTAACAYLDRTTPE